MEVLLTGQNREIRALTDLRLFWEFQVAGLAGKHVRALACGYYHAVALCAGGAAFTWGRYTCEMYFAFLVHLMLQQTLIMLWLHVTEKLKR